MDTPCTFLYGITAEYQGWTLTNVIEAESLEQAIDSAKSEFAQMFKSADDIKISEVSLIEPKFCAKCGDEVEME